MASYSRRAFIAGLSAGSFCAPQLLDARRLSSNPAESVSFGADYYPEDWPADRLEADARLMSEAKFRTIRIADTNWERLEPREGQYDFGWLDRVLKAMNGVGIEVILCTSSYSPPAWLITEHPEFMAMNEKGERRRWGGMGPMCLHNPLYREYVAKLVSALGARYGQHAGVTGWQVDNELGGAGNRMLRPAVLPAAISRVSEE